MPSPIDDGSPPANEDVPLNDSNEETMDTTIDQVAVEVPVPDEQPLPQQDEQPKKTDDAPMDEDPAEHIPDVEPTRASGEEELIVVSAPDETMEADVGRIQVEAIPAATEEAGITVKILDNKGKEDIMEVDEIKMVEETAGNGAENVTKTNEDAVDWNEQKKLGKAFDSALDRLQVRISASILALRTDEHEKAQNTFIEERQKKSNSIYASLSESAKETYHALVHYGSKFDLSSADPSSSKAMSETRRARLSSAGKNIWMSIRNNPELFEDAMSDEAVNGGGDYLAFEGKKHQALAGGYARAVAAQLVFLDYIDTRCSLGRPPCLSPGLEASGKQPSVKELVFGLKVFSRAGKALLNHSKNDPQASHNTLSLAVSCFHTINEMAVTNGEAAEEVKELLDDAFDAFTLLPNAASQFANARESNVDAVEDWPKLVIEHLTQAKKLLDEFCSLNSNDGRLTVSKVAILQKYLPSLARLCYKHGSQLVKIGKNEHASNALHISLDTTNSCLNEVRAAINKENDPLNESGSRKAKGQLLHNLEADLVVVTIEAFYVLSHIFQAEGKKEKALQCLNMVEQYMNEQKNRDDELYANAMSKVDKDFFSEGAVTALAIEGPKKQDKLDIKSRASNVRANAKQRHAQEKATLMFCRLMIYHKVQPCPSPDEELLIDKLIQDLAALSKYTKSSPSLNQINFSVAAIESKSADDHIFSLTLNAIRSIHIRRVLSSPQGSYESETDPYNVLLGMIPKSNTRHSFVLLDRLNAMLNIRFQMKKGTNKIHKLEHDTLQLAQGYIADSLLFEPSSSNASDTTLFVDNSKSMLDELFEKTKAHFARGVSLYHSSESYHMVASYSEMLERILNCDRSNDNDFESANAQSGEVLAIKAHALSMTGQSTEAYHAARDAWAKVKNVDTLVNLFHCSLRHQIKHSTCDTLLELDNAINELSLNGVSSDKIVAAFPRLSNSCVETGKGVGEFVLLGLQERWTKMLVASKSLHQVLHEKAEDNNALLELGGHSVFEVLRSYLENFEHVVTSNQSQKACETLLQVVETTLGFMVTHLRDTQSPKANKSRRKKKEGEPEQDFVLIWDDDHVKKFVGDRADCVWVAEQLWNLSNKLMMMSFESNVGDGRKYSSHLFAGAHDFCLLSEEERGASLSKDFLDIDVQVDVMSTPQFNLDQELSNCDISSEFSGQCLLLSAATAVDFVVNSKAPGPEVKCLLRRCCRRLSRAQDEFLLNSEDEDQQKDVRKMIALLTLRCLLGIEDDSFAQRVLVAGGLEAAILELFRNDHIGVLQNVYLVAYGAEEKRMSSFGTILMRACASHMSQIGKFALQVDTNFSLTLAEIQRKVIQSASATKDLIEVFKDVDVLVKKYKDSVAKDAATFYSKGDLDWLTIEAYNQGVSLTLLGDHSNAGILFASALNMISLCSPEVKSHAKSMHSALSNALSKHSSVSISTIVNQFGL